MVTSSGGTYSARMTNTVGGRRLLDGLEQGRAGVLDQVEVVQDDRPCGVPSTGLVAARRDTSRAASMLMAAPSRSTSITSGWTPAETRRQVSQVPSGGMAGQRRAAAKPLAAADFPGSGRPDEEVGVHGPGRRRGQRRRPPGPGPPRQRRAHLPWPDSLPAIRPETTGPTPSGRSAAWAGPGS